jgi:CubicO group peptidase (beta-lactamase class C family)
MGMKLWLGAALTASLPLVAAPLALDDQLESIRARHGVPGMAVAIARDGVIVGQGLAGVRKLGSPERITLDDKFHIGSNTKSMTATLAAMLVEEGKLTWKTTLAEGLPSLAPQLLPEWRDVTIEQLLSHQGGVPQDVAANGLWGRLTRNKHLPERDQRVVMAREILTKIPPLHPAGTKYFYSNFGYALVGHILETREGGRWEVMMKTRLFTPLGLTTAGFGAPASVGRVDEPWGHAEGPAGKLIPVPGGRASDNPAAIGPGGTVHCSTLDLLRYLMFHLRGRRGEPGDLLRPESFRELHRAHFPPSTYSFGWGLNGWPGMRGPSFGHAGSNTMFYSLMFFAPEANMAIVVNANAADAESVKAVGEAVAEITKRFLPPAPAGR